MILIDAALHELGETEIDVDIEFGNTEESTNDFELMDSTIKVLNPSGFYIPGTEIGGLFEFVREKTDQAIETLRGYSWRGLMAKSILMPPAGEDYLTVSGEANSVIASLLSGRLGDIFTASTAASGCTITDYQFPLYINLLDGIEGMLESYGYRLKITAQKVASNQPIQIIVQAVEAIVIAGTFNEDNGIPMTFELDNMGINHLICGGAGDLQNRMIRHLYIGENGEITTIQYYTGLKERQAFFDYGNAESEDDLIDASKEELLSLASHKTLKMKAPEDLELEIGDIVQGTFPDGTIIQSPVVRKIYKIQNSVKSYEYKIKGEE